MENEIPSKVPYDWTPQYALIGEFVVAFETVAFNFRWEIQIVLFWAARAPADLFDIFIHQKFYTIEPLWTTYRALVAFVLEENKEIQKKLFDLNKRAEEVFRMRNILLHGTYLFGDGFTSSEEPDAETFYFEKRVATVNKIEAREIRSVVEMKAHIQMVKQFSVDFDLVANEVRKLLEDKYYDPITHTFKKR